MNLERFLVSGGTFDFDKVKAELENRINLIPSITTTRVELDYGDLRKFDFYRISSNNIQTSDNVLFLSAGVHANEISGLLTMMCLPEIFEHAMNNNVKLIVYPIRNPSGITLVEGYPDRNANHRYNIISDRGSQNAGNNDFLRYYLSDGNLVDDLGDRDTYESWEWSSDIKTIRLPLETSIMHQLVKEDLAICQSRGAHIVGVLDLHQDLITEDVGPGAYYYSMEKNNSEIYQRCAKEIEALGVPILSNYHFSAGFPNGVGLTTNEVGGIVRYDGSFPDLISKVGGKYCITPETTGNTSIDIAIQVNLIWIKNIINMAQNT